MDDRQTAASEKRSPWQLTARDQLPLGWFLVLGWGFFCLLLAASSGPQFSPPLPGQTSVPRQTSPAGVSRSGPLLPELSKSRERPAFQVDLNRATWVELAQLPGVGPVLARRIVEYRRRHGRFDQVEHLLRVRGIGPRRLQQLRPFLRVDRAD